MKKRLLRGIGANAYSQCVTVIIQLVSLPAFLTAWGTEKYGVWILLSAAPSYLALSDLGFSTAAANDMTMAVARGDASSAVKTFQSVLTLILSLAALLMLLTLSALYVIPGDILTFSSVAQQGEVKRTLALLVIYVLVSLSSGIISACFRADGKYAFGLIAFETIRLVESISSILVALSGGGLEACAATLLTARLAGLVVTGAILKRKVSWIRFDGRLASKSDIRRLLAPALATLAIPSGFALILQGMVLIVGWLAPISSVATFSATRVVTRLLVQSVGLVNHAIMPEISIAAGGQRTSRLLWLIKVNVLAAVAMLVPGTVIVGILGAPLVAYWTSGRIQPDGHFVWIMAAGACLQGLWLSNANVLLALNRQIEYSYWFVGAAAAGLLAAYPLTKLFGIDGTAAASAGSDFVMLFLIAKKLIGGADRFGVKLEISPAGRVRW